MVASRSFQRNTVSRQSGAEARLNPQVRSVPRKLDMTWILSASGGISRMTSNGAVMVSAKCWVTPSA